MTLIIKLNKMVPAFSNPQEIPPNRNCGETIFTIVLK